MKKKEEDCLSCAQIKKANEQLMKLNKELEMKVL